MYVKKIVSVLYATVHTYLSILSRRFHAGSIKPFVLEGCIPPANVEGGRLPPPKSSHRIALDAYFDGNNSLARPSRACWDWRASNGEDRKPWPWMLRNGERIISSKKECLYRRSQNSLP